MEWRLYPTDVLFFRGTDPMNAGEHGAVAGLFPPAPEVLQGLVRTVAAEHAADTPDARRRLAGDLATTISLTGPYLIVERTPDQPIERWYPCPLDLWRKEGEDQWQPGTLGEPVESDLGRVRFLTHVPGGAERWIQHDGLEAYLRGEPVAPGQVAHNAAFWEMEPRIGIGRNATTRAAEEGRLYAPAYVRLRWREDQRDGPKHSAAPQAPDSARAGIGVRVSGLDTRNIDERALAGLVRLGGEGRTARLEVHEAARIPKCPLKDGDTAIRMVLLSPAHWRLRDGDPDRWLPPGFEEHIVDGTTEWRGTLGQKPVTLAGAATARPVRIGGWDMSQGVPKEARACIPAGSVYFLRTPDGAPHIHGQNINGNHADTGQTGEGGRRSGFGWTLTGAWQDDKGASA